MRRYSRKQYVKKMLKAIDLSRWGMLTQSSKTDGLRCIRRFEKVNGIRFNPFCKRHLDMVEGMAENETLFRRAKLFFRKQEDKAME